MQVNVNELEYCKLSVECIANAEEILNKRGTVLDTFKKAPVNGFRPGKAPLEVIKNQYRKQIDEALKRALAEDAYHEALFQHKLRPYGTPQFSQISMGEGKFICNFQLFVKPTFDLAPCTNLEIPKPHETVTIDMVAESMLQELRVRAGETIPYSDNDFVQKGDSVIVDFEGYLDGQKQDNLCATGEMFVVGKSSLPSFDDNILGMIIGDVREFDLVIENGLPSMLGKTAHFKVTLNMGSKTVPAALDDSLAQRCGKNTFAEIKELVYNAAFAQVAQSTQMSKNDVVAKKLLADNNLTVPSWLSLLEGQYLVNQSKLNWETLPDVDKEKYISLGEQTVKLSLILDAIRENHPEAQLTDQEVFDLLKRDFDSKKHQGNFRSEERRV